MTHERRLKRFLLPLEQLALLLSGRGRVVGHPFPPDAVIEMAFWNAPHSAWELVVRSDEFPHQFTGSVIPLDNGPVIAEAG